jgi:N-acetylmuramoyl-L-alanine amidase
VPLTQVAEFYRFPGVSRSGRSFTLARPGVELAGREGDKAISVNGLKIYLSYPVLPWGDRSLVSAFDVSHTIDAILRPPRQSPARVLQTVVIDAAHGGDEAGVRSSSHGPEKAHTMAIAHKLADELRGRGFGVVLTRQDDSNPSAVERAATANGTPGESVFVSLHLNGSQNRGAKGIESYVLAPAGTPATYDPDGTRSDSNFYLGNLHDPENTALATAVHGSLVVATRAPDLGLRRARFRELRAVQMPGVVARLGFLSHTEEGAKLASAPYQAVLAGAIAEGISRYANYLNAPGEPASPGNQQPKPQDTATLEIAEASLALPEGDAGDETLTLTTRIRAQSSSDLDPSRVDVEVYFLDLVDGEYLEPAAADPPEITWVSALPSWRESPVEELAVTLRRTQPPEPAPQRSHFGYVVRLLYDGTFQSVHSSPDGLDRCLHQFYPLKGEPPKNR